jgi:elongation factor G
MKAYRPEQIRNVGLFSHGGAGKTTLAEAMLFNAGTIGRLGRVEDGSTVSDYEPEETRRNISVNLALLPLEWRDHKVNLVDAPGYLDFAGEVREAIRAIDGALVLVDAVAGVEVGTELNWKLLDGAGIPRLIVVNKIDRENADYERTIEQLRARFGKAVVAVEVPIGTQDRFDGVVDLIRMCGLAGADMARTEIPTELKGSCDQFREQLVEAVAETDDDLISKYLEGEELGEDEVLGALHRAVAQGKIFPVVVASAGTNKGIRSLLDAIVDMLPSPVEHGAAKATELPSGKEVSLAPSSDGPLAALVFKTSADPFVGKLTYFRVFSGTLRADSHVWNSRAGKEERVGTLYVIRGKSQEPASQVGVGDIGAVAKLQDTQTGDTICMKDRQLKIEGIEFPNPVFSVAVEPKSKADLDKLGSALHRLVEEDPGIRVRRDPETAEMVLSGLGEQHIDVALERMKRKFGVEVTLHEPRVPYRETIMRKTAAEYKHKKQTGGHGQYGHVHIQVEPLPRGSGFEFAEKVVGGSVPKNYVPAVEKGVREALPEGILAGYPFVDLRVTLTDGSYHPVDSSEMAFKLASSQAFKKATEGAQPVLLEPVVDLHVMVPDQFVGDVMSDLNGKRARVQGMDPDNGTTTIHAQAPLAEIQRYSTDLRSITQGRGTYSMEFSHYEEVPAHAAQQVIADSKKREAAAAAH